MARRREFRQSRQLSRLAKGYFCVKFLLPYRQIRRRATFAVLNPFHSRKGQTGNLKRKMKQCRQFFRAEKNASPNPIGEIAREP